jgi:hypothetical protein
MEFLLHNIGLIFEVISDIEIEIQGKLSKPNLLRINFCD